MSSPLLMFHSASLQNIIIIIMQLDHELSPSFHHTRNRIFVAVRTNCILVRIDRKNLG